MEINDWIRASRVAAGLTQEQIARSVCRTKATVSSWEVGSHNPSWQQILTIYNVTLRMIPLPGLTDGTEAGINGTKHSQAPIVAQLVALANEAHETGVPEDQLKAVADLLKSLTKTHGRPT